MRARLGGTCGGLGLGLAVWLGAPPATASSGYPEIIQDRFDVPCSPSCTLCHRDNAGGYSTVVKPFGRALIDAGLEANDEQSLADALIVLQDSGTDSDEDGATDVAELGDGRDPNVTGAGDLCPVRYGCGARIAPRSDASEPALLVKALWALAIAWLRRKRQLRTG